MGEAKRRKLVDAVSGALTDEGKIIEAGWLSLKALWIAPDAPQEQIDQLRMAFFAGAQHLFGSIMSFLDAGEEPTERDLRRMDMVDKELRAFLADFQNRALPTKGRA